MGYAYEGRSWQELAPPSVAEQKRPPAVQRLFAQHGSPRPPHLVAASPWVSTQALAVQVRVPLPSGQVSPAAVQVEPVAVVQQQPPALQEFEPQQRWPAPPQASHLFAPEEMLASQLSPVPQPPLGQHAWPRSPQTMQVPAGPQTLLALVQV
jgi:hypothetical protein